MSDQKEAPWVLAAKTGKIGFANRLGRGRVVLGTRPRVAVVDDGADCHWVAGRRRRVSSGCAAVVFFNDPAFFALFLLSAIDVGSDWCPGHASRINVATRASAAVCRLRLLHLFCPTCFGAPIGSRGERVATMDWPWFCGASAV